MVKTSEQKAADLTAAFEGSAGYSSLTGNFDGAGISFGFIQYNFGSGTLQPVLRAMFAADPAEFRRCCTVMNAWFGKVYDHTSDLLAAANMGNAAAVKWARDRQDSGFRLLPHWTAIFKNLGAVPAFQAVQARFAKRYMDTARKIMKTFGFKSERALCLGFDIAVQCGSVTLGSRARYAKATVGRKIDELAKLEALARAVQFQDSRGWVQRDILSRKLTIAKGFGVVHGRAYNLAKDFGIGDRPATP